VTRNRRSYRQTGLVAPVAEDKLKQGSTMKTMSVRMLGAAFFLVTLVVAAEKPLTVPPERLQNYWLLADTGDTNVPNSGNNLNAPTCAAVSYQVEKDGSTSHVKLEKLVPAGDLGKVAISVVTGMRFAATKQNPGKTPVATYVVIPLNLPGATSQVVAERAERARVLAACELDGYGPLLKETVVPVR
jgi:hypothetical protein